MGERIAVTGATGFIGRNLCAGLEKAGYNVIKMSRNISGVGHVERPRKK